MKFFKYRILYRDGRVKDFLTLKAAMRRYYKGKDQYDLFDTSREDEPILVLKWHSNRWNTCHG